MTSNVRRKACEVLLMLCFGCTLYVCGRFNGSFMPFQVMYMLAVVAVCFGFLKLHEKIGLQKICRYGDNKSILTAIILALVIAVISTGVMLTRFQGKDDYALEIKEFKELDSKGLEYLPYFWEEEYLSFMMRKDAVDQLECFIRDPEIVLYEYPVSENTTYWKLSGLCVMLNEIMQGLNAEDKDSLGAMQKVFAAIDEIETANYEPDINPAIVTLFEIVMIWVVIVLAIDLLQWFRVNNYLKANGGLEKVLLRIQEEDGSEDAGEVYYDERSEEN